MDSAERALAATASTGFIVESASASASALVSAPASTSVACVPESLASWDSRSAFNVGTAFRMPGEPCIGSISPMFSVGVLAGEVAGDSVGEGDAVSSLEPGSFSAGRFSGLCCSSLAKEAIPLICSVSSYPLDTAPAIASAW